MLSLLVDFAMSSPFQDRKVVLGIEKCLAASASECVLIKSNTSNFCLKLYVVEDAYLLFLLICDSILLAVL